MVNILADGVASTKKRVAVLLDGTWNSVNDNTNVWRLKSLLASEGRDGFEQISYYSAGVGTAFGERFRGGMLGYGLNNEIIRAYEWLIDHYNVGDELFIFGFSRGAYTARSLSGLYFKMRATRGGRSSLGYSAVCEIQTRWRCDDDSRTHTRTERRED